MKHLNYWFSEVNSGEEFFVQTTNEAEAWAIAEQVFDDTDEEIDLHLIDVVSDAEAECVGLDTY
jgi:hypothetical protein